MALMVPKITFNIHRNFPSNKLLYSGKSSLDLFLNLLQEKSIRQTTDLDDPSSVIHKHKHKSRYKTDNSEIIYCILIIVKLYIIIYLFFYSILFTFSMECSVVSQEDGDHE